MKSIFYSLAKRISRSAKDELGTTLVETLVAIAILGVSAVAFIGALSTGSIAANTQDEGVIAQALGQTQLEDIKAAPYDSTGFSYQPISAPSGYTILIGANSSIYSDNNIQKITVTISRSGSPVLTLEDYKVNR